MLALQRAFFARFELNRFHTAIVLLDYFFSLLPAALLALGCAAS
jgi:hypothetical protein